MSSDKVRWFGCAKWCSCRTFANNTCWSIAILMWTGNWLPADISLQYATITLCALFTDRPVGPQATDHSITALLSVSSALCILSLLHSDAALVEIRNNRTFTFSMHVFSWCKGWTVQVLARYTCHWFTLHIGWYDVFLLNANWEVNDQVSHRCWNEVHYVDNGCSTVVLFHAHGYRSPQSNK